MDEHTPIDVPIRLEEWDRHDCINEVDTIVVDIRLILDATDYGHLPAPDDWTADFIAEEAWTRRRPRPRTRQGWTMTAACICRAASTR